MDQNYSITPITVNYNLKNLAKIAIISSQIMSLVNELRYTIIRATNEFSDGLTIVDDWDKDMRCVSCTITGYEGEKKVKYIGYIDIIGRVCIIKRLN